MHLVRTVLIMLEATKTYCYEEVRNYGKTYSSKTLLKMAGGGMHTQHTPHPYPSCIITKDGLKFKRVVLN